MKKTYEVIGPQRVKGARRGEKVDLDLTEDQERTLLQAGHIRPVTRPKAVADEEKN